MTQSDELKAEHDALNQQFEQLVQSKQPISHDMIRKMVALRCAIGLIDGETKENPYPCGWIDPVMEMDAQIAKDDQQ